MALSYAEKYAKLQELRAKRARLAEEIETIRTQNDGVRLALLPPNIRTRAENTLAARNKADDEIESLEEELRGDLAAMAGNGHVDTPAAQPRSSADASPMDRTRSVAMRTVDASVRSGVLPAYAAERVERLVTTGREADQTMAARWVAISGTDEYRSAFAKLVADPERGHLEWTPEEHRAFKAVRQLQRAMSHTGTSGGFMVPFQLDPTVILTNAGTINPLRAVSRVVQTVSDSWNGVSSAGATASWDAEGAEVSDDSPTFAQPSVPNYKGQAFIPYSVELEGDVPGLLNEVTTILTDAATRLMATAYTTGAGATEPKGIIKALDGTASEVAPTTAESFTSPDVYKVQNALPPRWQANARWMAALPMINVMDQFETSNGSKLFPEVGSASPVLLRKPLHENSDMDGTYNAAATADNFLLLYGDFQQFVISDRIGTTVELIPHLFGDNKRPTGQRGALMWFRTGSDVTAVDAFRVLNVATTA